MPLVEATELGEQVAAHARQEMIPLQRGLRSERRSAAGTASAPPRAVGHGRDGSAGRSQTLLSAARPCSNWLPIIASMLMKRLMTFATRVFCPSIAHVTLVPVPSGNSVKVAVFDASK